MKSKRGQAALEFLTTYGWAFLVILVMIGALAYFGVLDPTRFIPQRCQFGQELYCERFSLQAAGPLGGANAATFELRNNLQDTLHIDNVQYALDATPDTFVDCAAQEADSTDLTGAGEFGVIRANSVQIVCEDAALALNPGQKTRIHFKVIYSQAGTAFDTTFASSIFGEVFANVN